ncbi:hypothetical protein GUJ93_ZPchr0005g14765 [Zizania palustris]|uniref:Uncharacterized protein n=1 Tax=Zizania palustris TaxID=103762 RepID=A0A8J5W0N8_ZIZPA|nr:hypothetical protein GUJ93_ZPchr0005g14765 [Zizania palustris]
MRNRQLELLLLWLMRHTTVEEGKDPDHDFDDIGYQSLNHSSSIINRAKNSVDLTRKEASWLLLGLNCGHALEVISLPEGTTALAKAHSFDAQEGPEHVTCLDQDAYQRLSEISLLWLLKLADVLGFSVQRGVALEIPMKCCPPSGYELGWLQGLEIKLGDLPQFIGSSRRGASIYSERYCKEGFTKCLT